jgi:hypothetical protein
MSAFLYPLAIIGAIALLGAIAVFVTLKYPDPPVDFGPDSKLNS